MNEITNTRLVPVTFNCICQDLRGNLSSAQANWKLKRKSQVLAHLWEVEARVRELRSLAETLS